MSRQSFQDVLHIRLFVPQAQLKEKDWNIKDALQFFTQLVKLNPGSIINNTSPSELVT